MESRRQKNPRPRTVLSRTDPLEAKDRNAFGQGHNAEGILKKRKGLRFKIQALFKKKSLQWSCPRAKDRAFSRTWRLRGQGLDLQDQELQIVYSRTPPLVLNTGYYVFLHFLKIPMQEGARRNPFKEKVLVLPTECALFPLSS